MSDKILSAQEIYDLAKKALEEMYDADDLHTRAIRDWVEHYELIEALKKGKTRKIKFEGCKDETKSD